MIKWRNTVQTQGNRIWGLALVVTAATLWGLMGIFVRKLSAAGYSSYDISFVRCILAGIGFFLYKAITQPSVLKIDSRGLIVCMLYGLCAYAAGFIAYGTAVERIPLAVATVLMFMSPIWISLLGVLFFRERLCVKMIAVILLCLFGAMLVANVFGSAVEELDGIGIAAGVANGFGVALQLIIPRFFLKQYQRDTMLIYGFLGAAIGLIFLTDFQTIIKSLQGPDAITILGSMLFLGLLCTMVANVAFVNAAAYINMVTCGVLSSLEVVVGAAVGVFVFHESLSLLQIIGAAIVVSGTLGAAVPQKNKNEERLKEQNCLER